METREFIKTLRETYDFMDIRAMLYEKQGIGCGYESFVEADDHKRFILYIKNRRLADMSSGITLGCNGLIMNHANELLTIPPRVFQQLNKYNPQFIKDNLDKYRILYAQEGTTVTLYYYNERWEIATCHGISVNDVSWNNDKTYQQVFDECLHSVDQLDLYDNLDKSRSYTFLFNHPDYHVFRENIDSDKDKPRIWFVQSADLITGGVEYESPFENIPEQKQVTDLPIADAKDPIKFLRSIADRGMETYYESVKNGNPDPLYGFILRSKVPEETKENSDFVIESTLLKSIRYLYTNNIYTRSAKELDMPRHKYVLLYNFIMVSNREDFMFLFPQFIKIFDKFEHRLDTFIKEVEKVYHARRLTKSEADLCKPAVRFVEQLSSKIHINVNDNKFKKIIKGFIINTPDSISYLESTLMD